MYYVRHLLTLLLCIVASPSFAGVDCSKIDPVIGRIEGSTFKQIQKIADDCLNEEKETRLTISSPGGNFGYTVAIFDTLKNSKGNKGLTTIAQGEVSSAGVLIFLAGYERLISCNATLFVHHPIISLNINRLGSEALSVFSQNIARDKVTQMRLYREVTTLPVDTLNQMLDNEVTMTAEEAVRYGFATRIVGYCVK